MNNLKPQHSHLIMSDSSYDENGDVQRFRSSLLAWYREHHRRLPWRANPCQTNSPYHVWLSEIMLQQTVVATVIPYFTKFVDKWPTVQDLAGAKQEEVMAAWAGLGYYARARNLHKCAQVVANELNGVFPDNEEELLKLPGIGPYTAAAITAIAFQKEANVVDGNVERVMARIFAVTNPMPESKPELKTRAATFTHSQTETPGDYAQALMDLGATICTPKSPKCMLCPVREHCRAKERGIEAELPTITKKKPNPKKWGYVYWIENTQGQILIETRPEKGMLGGMIGFPTSEWLENKKELKDLFDLDWETPKHLKVKHSFTHFDLTLTGKINKLGNGSNITGENHKWVDKDQLHTIGLPTLFKKFLKLIT